MLHAHDVYYVFTFFSKSKNATFYVFRVAVHVNWNAAAVKMKAFNSTATRQPSCLSVCLSVRLFELKSGALQCCAEKLVRLIALCERLLFKFEQKAAYFNRFQLSVKYGMRVADKGATSSSNTTGSIEQRSVSESTAHKTRLTSDSRHNTDI